MSVDRPLALRGWCAGLAGLTAAFAAYISLVPFNFTLPSDTTLIEAFLRSLEADLHSRSNFAGNVLLFMPIGFFGGGAVLSGAPRRARHLFEAVALVAVSIAWSFAIEFLQVLVPGRTPSLADVIAQTAGLLAGMAAWLVLSRDIHRWAKRRGSERGHGALHTALLVFAAGRAVAMLLPLDVTLDLGLLAEKHRNGLIVLNPMRSPALSSSFLSALLAETAFSIPIGVLACLAFMPQGTRRRAGLALLLGLAFVGFLEVAQVFVMSRTADVVDWFVNAIGVAAGVGLMTRLLPGRVGPASAVSRSIPVGGLVASLAFYMLYNWSPFDFQLSGELIRARLPMILGVPFHSYYETPEIKAIGELLVKIAIGVPIGLFLGWWIRGSFEASRRFVVAIASTSTLIFLTLVEAGQILLPTRYPDTTDILLGMTGVLVGSWVARGFFRAEIPGS